ncbi:hypothetical protein TWF594_011339 [Orbilia oligospora]|nr:hypothetical protein TWF706_008850 [Orbilia oligospora]KAF3149294.1 hypothetical protein TWF594_011339 [Orbilia oligospora]
MQKAKLAVRWFWPIVTKNRPSATQSYRPWRRTGLTVIVRLFWQLHPAALVCSHGTVRFRSWIANTTLQQHVLVVLPCLSCGISHPRFILAFAGGQNLEFTATTETLSAKS